VGFFSYYKHYLPGPNERSTQCAALCRTNVNVQELLVQGALPHDREAIKHAMMLDLLTAAVCTLD